MTKRKACVSSYLGTWRKHVYLKFCLQIIGRQARIQILHEHFIWTTRGCEFARVKLLKTRFMMRKNTWKATINSSLYYGYSHQFREYFLRMWKLFFTQPFLLDFIIFLLHKRCDPDIGFIQSIKSISVATK